MIIPGTTYCLVAVTDNRQTDRRQTAVGRAYTVHTQCTMVARVHTCPPLSSHSCCADCSKSTLLRALCDQWKPFFHVSRLEMNVIWTDFSDVCRVLNSRWQWRILVGVKAMVVNPKQVDVVASRSRLFRLSWNVLIANCTGPRGCTKWDRRDGLTKYSA